MKNICIIIPTFNNPNKIQEVVENALLLNVLVIVVDDFSPIKAREILTVHPNLSVLEHTESKGVIASILSGVEEAKKRMFDYSMVVDESKELSIKALTDIYPLLDKKSIIIEKRVFTTPVPFTMKLKQKSLSLLTWWVSGEWISDTNPSFILYPISILNLDLSKNNYNNYIEIIIKHFWANNRVKKIDIETYRLPQRVERSSYQSKSNHNTLLYSKLFIQNIMHWLTH